MGFEELKGSPKSVKSKLGRSTEVYSEGERKIMGTSLSVAHKWASDASVKLGSTNKDTLFFKSRTGLVTVLRQIQRLKMLPRNFSRVSIELPSAVLQIN
jgi:hypothetical protein